MRREVLWAFAGLLAVLAFVLAWKFLALGPMDFLVELIMVAAASSLVGLFLAGLGLVVQIYASPKGYPRWPLETMAVGLSLGTLLVAPAHFTESYRLAPVKRQFAAVVTSVRPQVQWSRSDEEINRLDYGGKLEQLVTLRDERLKQDRYTMLLGKWWADDRITPDLYGLYVPYRPKTRQLAAR